MWIHQSQVPLSQDLPEEVPGHHEEMESFPYETPWGDGVLPIMRLGLFQRDWICPNETGSVPKRLGLSQREWVLPKETGSFPKRLGLSQRDWVLPKETGSVPKKMGPSQWDWIPPWWYLVLQWEWVGPWCQIVLAQLRVSVGMSIYWSIIAYYQFMMMMMMKMATMMMIIIKVDMATFLLVCQTDIGSQYLTCLLALHQSSNHSVHLSPSHTACV